MSNLKPISSDEFTKKVLQSPIPVLVDFSAPWCGPCKMLDPVLEDLAQQYDGEVDFYSVDVDQNPALVNQFGVMGVPTVILFREGEAVERLTGFRPKKALEKIFFGKY